MRRTHFILSLVLPFIMLGMMTIAFASGRSSPSSDVSNDLPSEALIQSGQISPDTPSHQKSEKEDSQNFVGHSIGAPPVGVTRYPSSRPQGPQLHDASGPMRTAYASTYSTLGYYLTTPHFGDITQTVTNTIIYSPTYVSFDIGEPTTYTHIKGDESNPYWKIMAADLHETDGVIYAANILSQTIEWITIDPTTGITTWISNMSGTEPGEALTGLAINPVDDTIYASGCYITPTYTISMPTVWKSTTSLYTINSADGAITFISKILPDDTGCIISLAIDNSEQLYGLDIISDKLVPINSTTGAGTLLTHGVGYNANYTQGMDFDPDTNILYLATYNQDTERSEWRIANLDQTDPLSGSTVLIEPLGVEDPWRNENLGWVAIKKGTEPDTDKDIYLRKEVCLYNECATDSDNNQIGEVAVFESGSTVTYTYQVINTGEVTWKKHWLTEVPPIGSVISSPFPVDVDPIETYSIQYSTTVTNTIVDTATWGVADNAGAVGPDRNAIDNAMVIVPSIHVTGTVRPTADVYSNTTNVITVTPGTTVTFFYEGENTTLPTLYPPVYVAGNFLTHKIDDNWGTYNTSWDLPTANPITPSIRGITDTLRTRLITETTVNTITWTATLTNSNLSEDDIQAVDVTSVTVVVVEPTGALTTTVSKNHAYSSTREITVTTDAEVVYFYELVNTGPVSLTVHDLYADAVTIRGGRVLSNDIGITLSPTGTSSATVIISNTEKYTQVGKIVNTAVWTTSDGKGFPITYTSVATVNVVASSIVLSKSVGIGASFTDTKVISVPAGTEVTYFYRVTNVGDAAVNVHELYDNFLAGRAIVFSSTTNLDTGEVYTHTETAVIITQTTVNTATWIAYNSTINTPLVSHAEDWAQVIVLEPSINMTKTVALASADCSTGVKSLSIAEGDTVRYCYEVENTGLVTVTNYEFVDSTLPPSTTIAGTYTLAPNDTYIYSWTQTITAGTFNGTVISNTATWRTWDDYSYDVEATDAATVTLLASSLDLTKTVAIGNECGNDKEITTLVGSNVTYCYEVVNTGEITLTTHQLSDNFDLLGDLLLNEAIDLGPGASYMYSATITMEASGTFTNPEGVFTNTATWSAVNAFGYSTAVATDTATVIVKDASAYVSKTVTFNTDACGSDSEITGMGGEEVRYCYSIENTGDWVVTYSLTDDKLDFLYDSSVPIGDVSDFFIVETINTTTTNIATWVATATVQNGDYIYNKVLVYSDTATVNTDPIPNPSMSLAKTVGLDGNTCATTSTLNDVGVGEEVTYCYVMENTGNVPLTSHDLDDDILGSLIGNEDFLVYPGESYEFKTRVNILETTTNVAEWTAQTSDIVPDMEVVTATDTATVNVVEPVAGLDFSMTVGTTPGTCGTETDITVEAGTQVIYCYQAANTGNTALTNHNLTDSFGQIVPALLTMTVDSDWVIYPSETVTLFTAQVITDYHKNTATWSASTENPFIVPSLNVQKTDSVVVRTPALNPSMVLTKTVSADGTCASASSIQVEQDIDGTDITYCYTMHNTGDTPLSTHNLMDDKLGILLENDTGFVVESGNTHSFTYTTKISTTTVNTATWTAIPVTVGTLGSMQTVVTATDMASVLVGGAEPGLTLTVTVSPVVGQCGSSNNLNLPDTLSIDGVDVQYCYIAENTGNVPLSLHNLTDNTLPILVNDSGFIIYPNQTVVVTRTEHIFLDVTNSITWSSVVAVAGMPSTVVSHTAEASVTFVVPNMNVSIAKSVSESRQGCGTEISLEVFEGSEVTYCYKVANLGNLTLNHHTLFDDRIGTIVDDDYGFQIEPGKTVIITHTYYITELSVINIAYWKSQNITIPGFDYITATGTSNQVLVTPIPRPVTRPGIRFEKTVGTESGVCATDTEIFVQPDTEVTYCFKATNVSTTSVTFITHSLVDDQLGTILDGDTSFTLADGESHTELVSTVISASITNTARWTSFTADSNDRYESEATAHVTVDTVPPDFDNVDPGDNPGNPDNPPMYFPVNGQTFLDLLNFFFSFLNGQDNYGIDVYIIILFGPLDNGALSEANLAKQVDCPTDIKLHSTGEKLDTTGATCYETKGSPYTPAVPLTNGDYEWYLVAYDLTGYYSSVHGPEAFTIGAKVGYDVYMPIVLK